MALLWPIGPLAFVVTVSGLVVAAPLVLLSRAAETYAPCNCSYLEASPEQRLRLLFAERVRVVPDQELLRVEAC